MCTYSMSIHLLKLTESPCLLHCLCVLSPSRLSEKKGGNEEASKMTETMTASVISLAWLDNCALLCATHFPTICHCITVTGSVPASLCSVVARLSFRISLWMRVRTCWLQCQIQQMHVLLNSNSHAEDVSRRRSSLTLPTHSSVDQNGL